MELKLQVQQKGHATSKTKNKLLLKVYLHFVVNWRLVKEKTKQELVSTGALSNNNFFDVVRLSFIQTLYHTRRH